jgi:membrane protein
MAIVPFTIKRFITLLVDSYREFQNNDPLRMAAATSFFTTFALPAILIILIEIFEFFGSSKTISHDLLHQLNGTIDRKTVEQIGLILRNVHYLPLSWYAKAGGFIFLIFVATTLFNVIKDSLNQLWKVRQKENQGILFILGYRAKSVAVIIMIGMLFLIVLSGETTRMVLQQYVTGQGRVIKFLAGKFIDQLLSTLAVSICFSVIFRFLADGRPRGKTAIAGGLFTGLLFTVGKILLQSLLSYNMMQTIYGASTAFVLLLLFVFYASFIFYYGACFTMVLANYGGHPVRAAKHAISYTINTEEIKNDAMAES